MDHPAASAGQAYHTVDEHCPTLAQWIEIIGGAVGHTPQLVNLPNELAQPACNPYLKGHHTHHYMLGNTKAAVELGYQDRVPMREAVAAYARWLVANPPQGGQLKQLQDPFDYEAEDRVVAAWRRGVTGPGLACLRSRLTFGLTFLFFFFGARQSTVFSSTCQPAASCFSRGGPRATGTWDSRDSEASG